jgi:hypothetical protein
MDKLEWKVFIQACKITKLKLSNSLEQSPSGDATSQSASPEIARLLWNPKIRYRVHKIPPLVPTLSQIYSVHVFIPSFPKIRYNIILPCTPKSFKSSPSFTFPNQNFVCVSHPCHAWYIPIHLIVLKVITLITYGEAYKSRSSSLCSLLQPPDISSLLDPTKYPSQHPVLKYLQSMLLS